MHSTVALPEQKPPPSIPAKLDSDLGAQRNVRKRMDVSKGVGFLLNSVWNQLCALWIPLSLLVPSI